VVVVAMDLVEVVGMDLMVVMEVAMVEVALV